MSNLTDGVNFYGAILPVREWLNQLARRHELERAVLEEDDGAQGPVGKRTRRVYRNDKDQAK